MKYWINSLCGIALGLMTGCETGIRKLDFESKQFLATYNIDSTQGIDSSKLASLMNSKSIYTFSEAGKGTNHIQQGMLSKDTPFTWRVEHDSLQLDKQKYAVERQERGFILRSDSVKMYFSKQP